MEELAQQTQEAYATLAVRKDEVAAVLAVLEDEKVQQAQLVADEKKRLNLIEDDVLHLKRKRDSIHKETAEEVAEIEANEAKLREAFQELADRKEQLLREIEHMKNLIEHGVNHKAQSFGDLIMTIVDAHDLPQTSKFDKNDPYCIVSLQGTEHRHQTKTALDAGQDAVFNETVTWSDISENTSTLKIEVWEDDELKDDELMGKGVLDLKGVYKKARKKMEKIKKRAVGGDDGMIDLKELEAWMKVHHAEHILNMTPEQIMSKYDADGSGQLDREEMEEIAEWVAREQLKQENAREGEGHDEGPSDLEKGKENHFKIQLAKKGHKHQGCVRLRIQLVLHDEDA